MITQANANLGILIWTLTVLCIAMGQLIENRMTKNKLAKTIREAEEKGATKMLSAVKACPVILDSVSGHYGYYLPVVQALDTKKVVES